MSTLLEFRIAATLPLGARLSGHSGIIGTLGLSPEAGRARETLCRTLADRALVLGEELGFLHEESPTRETLGMVFSLYRMFCLTNGHGGRGETERKLLAIMDQYHDAMLRVPDIAVEQLEWLNTQKSKLRVNDAWGAVISRDVLTWFVLFVDDRRHAQVFVLADFARYTAPGASLPADIEVFAVDLETVMARDLAMVLTETTPTSNSVLKVLALCDICHFIRLSQPWLHNFKYANGNYFWAGSNRCTRYGGRYLASVGDLALDPATRARVQDNADRLALSILVPMLAGHRKGGDWAANLHKDPSPPPERVQLVGEFAIQFKDTGSLDLVLDAVRRGFSGTDGPFSLEPLRTESCLGEAMERLEVQLKTMKLGAFCFGVVSDAADDLERTMVELREQHHQYNQAGHDVAKAVATVEEVEPDQDGSTVTSLPGAKQKREDAAEIVHRALRDLTV